MTNPNTGTPIQIAVPEALAGGDRFSAELDAWDDTTSADEQARTGRRLAADLDRAAEYGRALWHQLETVTAYLREDIAHADIATGMLADDDRRHAWAELYGRTLSLLAGPRGDSGFGAEQALLELQHLEH
jgi:hypothetical protein